MTGGTERSRLNAFSVQTSIPALRGTYLGVLLHPQGHRAVVHLGDGGAGLQLWSLDPPSVMDVIEFQAQTADQPFDLADENRPFAWKFNQGVAPEGLLPVNGMASSHNGDIVVAAAGRQVRTLRLSEDDARLEPRITLPPLDGPLAHIAIARSADKIFCADASGELVILSALDGREVHRLGLTPKPRVLKFIWADKLVLVGDELGRVTCWNTKTGQRHLQFQAHHGAIRSACFDSSRRLLLTTGKDGTARLWNLEDGVQVGVDMALGSPVLTGLFARQGQLVLCVTEDGLLHACHSGNGVVLDSFQPPGGCWDLAVSDARGLVVVVGQQGLHHIAVDWAMLMEARGQSSMIRPDEGSIGANADTPPAVPVTHEKKLGDAPIGAVMPHFDASQEIRIPDAPPRRPREGSGLVRPAAAAVRRPAPPTATAAPDASKSFFETPEEEKPVRPSHPSGEHSRVRAVFRRPDARDAGPLEIDDSPDEEPAERKSASVAEGKSAGVYVREAPTASSRPDLGGRLRRDRAESTSGGLGLAALLALVGALIGVVLAFALAPGGASSEEVQALTEQRDAAIASANAELDDLQVQQQRRLDDFAARTSLQSEVDRMRRQVASSIREAERHRDLTVEHAERTWADAVDEAGGSAEAQQQRSLLINAGAGAFLGFLLGLVLGRVRREGT